MYFSKIRFSNNNTHREIMKFANSGGYSLHKIIWRFFADSPDRKRDYLFRHEAENGLPMFYAVSERKPIDRDGLWEISTKSYEPKLYENECLEFKLRANPVQLAKKNRSPDEIEKWRDSRHKRNLKEKKVTKKRVRHDVVMAEKVRIGYKDLPVNQRPHMATLIQNAGLSWLREKSADKGFLIKDIEDEQGARADGYCQQRFYKEKGSKKVEFSTLEFNGFLTVTDPEVFIQKCLFKGIGPAKGFGCGLMMVKRI